MESVTVRGVDVPALGLGTYQLRGQACVQTVREAIEMGYRHIDTAEYYNNQREVGHDCFRFADPPVCGTVER